MLRYDGGLQPCSLGPNGVVSTLLPGLLLILHLLPPSLVFLIVTVRVVQNLSQVVGQLHDVAPVVVVIRSGLVQLEQLLGSAIVTFLCGSISFVWG